LHSRYDATLREQPCIGHCWFVIEFTINSGYELCEFENDNIEIPPNTLSLFDISNTIQGIRDFDKTDELEKENGLK
jgi:hypothetical protein